MAAAEFVTVLLITLALIVLSFVSGLKLAEHYHRSAMADKEYALQRQYARLRAGTDADDPMGPYVPNPNP